MPDATCEDKHAVRRECRRISVPVVVIERYKIARTEILDLRPVVSLVCVVMECCMGRNIGRLV